MSSKTMADMYKELDEEEVLDYDKWKTGVGKDQVKAGGTSYDEVSNRANYNAYSTEIGARNSLNRQRAQLEQNKRDAYTAVQENRENAMRDISVMTDRAKEYVERRAKLNGTSTAGVSQTSMIDLYSQMAGNRASAQASYDGQEQSIIQEYRNAINSAENNYDNVVSSSRQNTNNIVANNEIERLKVQEQKAEQASKEAIQNAKDMAEAQNALNNLALTYSTYTELEAAINTFNTRYGKENLPDGILDKLEAAKAGTKSQYTTEQEAAQAARDAIQKAEDMAAAQNVLNNLALSYTTATELEMAINTFNATYGSENLPEGILDKLAAAKAGTKSQYTTEQEAAQAARDAIQKAEDMAAAKTALNNLTLTYTSATELEVAINTYKDLYGEENLPDGILDKLEAAKAGEKSQFAKEELEEDLKIAVAELKAMSLNYESYSDFLTSYRYFAHIYGEDNIPQSIKDALASAEDGEKSQAEKEQMTERERAEEEAKDAQMQIELIKLNSVLKNYEYPSDLEDAINLFAKNYGEENLPEGIRDTLADIIANKTPSESAQWDEDMRKAQKAKELEEQLPYAQAVLKNAALSYYDAAELEMKINEFEALYGADNVPQEVKDILKDAQDNGTLSKLAQEQQDKLDVEKAEAEEEAMEYELAMLESLSKIYTDPYDFVARVDEFKARYKDKDVTLSDELQTIYDRAASGQGSDRMWRDEEEKAEAEKEARDDEFAYDKAVLRSLCYTYETTADLLAAKELFIGTWGEDNVPEFLNVAIKAAEAGELSMKEAELQGREREAAAEQAHINALANDMQRFLDGDITLEDLYDSYDRHGAELDLDIYADLHSEFDRVCEVTEKNATDTFSQNLEAYKKRQISLDELNKSFEECSKYISSEALDGEIFEEYYSEKLNDKLRTNFVKHNDLGVTSETPSYFVSDITAQDLLEELDVAGGNDQTRWVEDVLEKINNGEIKAGTIINFNYGKMRGNNDGNYYVYHRGKLYQTTLNRTSKINPEYYTLLENAEGNMW